MAIIPQPYLFSWKEVDASSDILRLQRVLDVLPDEPLMRVLEEERKGKRDDFPTRAMWNALIAGVVFGHVSSASLLRELGRNGQLHDLCGFRPGTGAPSESAFSRFLAKVRRHRAFVDAMFEEMVDRLAALLPDFGTNLAIDGKDIKTHGRNDPDAGIGAKAYWSEEDSSFQEIKKWFGYKLHLVVDADHELPVAWELTSASVGESPRLMALVETIEVAHPEVLERTETLAADRGYDDGADKAMLYDAYGIMPVMDTRDMAKGAMKALDEQHHDTIYYSPTGTVCCKVDPFEADPNKAFADMQFMGFEKDRESLKYRCPAAAFGLECHNRSSCRCRGQVREGSYGRVVRVPLSRDRRIFLPIARHSQAFQQAYNKRTAVERVNSRIDQVYGFERHFIRGMETMKLRVGLALLVMAATAVAWIEAGKPKHMRSLVRAA